MKLFILARELACASSSAPNKLSRRSRATASGAATRLAASRRYADLPVANRREADLPVANRREADLPDMVENTGLEPVTSWLQTRRSPS